MLWYLRCGFIDLEAHVLENGGASIETNDYPNKFVDKTIAAAMRKHTKNLCQPGHHNLYRNPFHIS